MPNDSVKGPALELSEHHTTAADGRKVTIWRTYAPGMKLHATPIVIAPGFSRRMDHLCPLAMYLAMNGFDVYRYDALDHIGLSDGEILDFTMTAGLTSMRAAIAWLSATAGTSSIGLIAMSLSARVAYRLVTEVDSVAFLLTAVGVVNLASTLRCVWGFDLAGTPLDQLPPFVDFEKHDIRTAHFCSDAHDRDWWSLDGTIAELRRFERPLVTFASLADDWVDAVEQRAALMEGPGMTRRIIELEGSAHDLGRNPAVARLFFTRTTQEIMKLAGVPAEGEIAEPSFEAITACALGERRRQRAQGGEAKPGAAKPGGETKPLEKGAP